MAKFGAFVETKATGHQPIAFEVPEERAQLIFKMLLGKAAKKTDSRSVDDVRTVTVDGKDVMEPFTRDESFQRDATLGEALEDRFTAFIFAIENEAMQWDADEKARAAREDVSTQLTATRVEE